MPKRKVGLTRPGPRAKFRWSDDQILKVIRPRALPVYSDKELEVLRDLAIEGASHILSRRAGGRKRRDVSLLADLRRILIQVIFDGLPARLRDTYLGVRTLARIRDELAERYNINVSADTVLKDVKKIGKENLRRGVSWASK